jgi:hypothetical protein
MQQHRFLGQNPVRGEPLMPFALMRRPGRGHTHADLLNGGLDHRPWRPSRSTRSCVPSSSTCWRPTRHRGGGGDFGIQSCQVDYRAELRCIPRGVARLPLPTRPDCFLRGFLRTYAPSDNGRC